jgi:hypothetical protein
MSVEIGAAESSNFTSRSSIHVKEEVRVGLKKREANMMADVKANKQMFDAGDLMNYSWQGLTAGYGIHY